MNSINLGFLDGRSSRNMHTKEVQHVPEELMESFALPAVADVRLAILHTHLSHDRSLRFRSLRPLSNHLLEGLALFRAVFRNRFVNASDEMCRLIVSNAKLWSW
jgi:hypothetical protein